MAGNTRKAQRQQMADLEGVLAKALHTWEEEQPDRQVQAFGDSDQTTDENGEEAFGVFVATGVGSTRQQEFSVRVTALLEDGGPEEVDVRPAGLRFNLDPWCACGCREVEARMMGAVVLTCTKCGTVRGSLEGVVARIRRA